MQKLITVTIGLALTMILALRCGPMLDDQLGPAARSGANGNRIEVKFKALVEGQSPSEANLSFLLISRKMPSGREQILYADKYQGAVPLEPGRYNLYQAMCNLTAGDGAQWTLQAMGGPEFDASTGTTVILHIAKPALIVESRVGKRRGDQDGALVIARGTNVYLGRKVADENGMVYPKVIMTRPGEEEDMIEPQTRVTGPDGSVVASGAMEYG